MFKWLKDNEIFCVGNTLVQTNLMMKNLKRLIQEFFIVKDAYKCAYQAMHNVLIHNNLIEPVFKCYNSHGPILTVGTEPTYLTNNQNKLINRNGELIPIIHQ